MARIHYLVWRPARSGGGFHGASAEVYLDHAKIYHAGALKAACFALNLRLLHRPVGDPAPGGLIERFFGTTQSQFEAEVRAGEILTLDRLNRALAAWLEVSYHQRPHSETGQPPHERYQQALQRAQQRTLPEIVFLFQQLAQEKERGEGCFSTTSSSSRNRLLNGSQPTRSGRTIACGRDGRGFATWLSTPR